MTEELKVYVNGEIVSAQEAKISVFDRGFQYGDGVFEGIRCYGGKVFKLEEHVRRLYDSARSVHIEIPLSPSEMKKAIKDTILANGFMDAHIKPIVTRGNGWKLGLDPRNFDRPNIVIFVRSVAGSMYGDTTAGIRLAVVSIRKVPASSLDPRVKSLNYLVNILARAEAQASGADEAIMLDNQGFVAEGSGDNIFIVRREALWTSPIQCALEGITRHTVLEMASEASIETRESSLTIYDVYTADEVFVTGSGAGIVPVAEVDKKVIGNGKPGPITQRLIQMYADAVKHGEPLTG
jgi:branched-chain amino acid aminotransferase